MYLYRYQMFDLLMFRFFKYFYQLKRPFTKQSLVHVCRAVDEIRGDTKPRYRILPPLVRLLLSAPKISCLNFDFNPYFTCGFTFVIQFNISKVFLYKYWE